MSSLYFQILSLFYIVLVMCVYFFKNKIPTVENKIFSYVIIVNFFTLIFDIVSTYLAIIDFNSIVLIQICKIYLCCLIIWIVLMTSYIFAISTKEHKKKNIKQIAMVLSSFCVISIILVLVLPLYSNR